MKNVTNFLKTVKNWCGSVPESTAFCPQHHQDNLPQNCNMMRILVISSTVLILRCNICLKSKFFKKIQ